MMRKEIEALMKQKGWKTIVLIMNESDPLGVYCELQGGFLQDFTGHRVNRTHNIWGYLNFEQGKGVRTSF